MKKRVAFELVPIEAVRPAQKACLDCEFNFGQKFYAKGIDSDALIYSCQVKCGAIPRAEGTVVTLVNPKRSMYECVPRRRALDLIATLPR